MTEFDRQLKKPARPEVHIYNNVHAHKTAPFSKFSNLKEKRMCNLGKDEREGKVQKNRSNCHPKLTENESKNRNLQSRIKK